MKRHYAFAVLSTLLYVCVGNAQQYPIMDKIANKVIQKYQTSTCEQLWQKKAQKAPPSQQEQQAIQMLKSDPQMRAGVHQQDCRSDRQQDVRLRHDSVRCAGIVPGGPTMMR